MEKKAGKQEKQKQQEQSRREGGREGVRWREGSSAMRRVFNKQA